MRSDVLLWRGCGVHSPAWFVVVVYRAVTVLLICSEPLASVWSKKILARAAKTGYSEGSKLYLILIGEMMQKKEFVKPVVLISRCLGFEACRYNGAMISAPFIQELSQFITPLAPCPEVEVGLGVPRDAIRIVVNQNKEHRLVQPASGRDITTAMKAFTEDFCAGLGSAPAMMDGAILKAKSPSCGRGTVKTYAAAESKQPSEHKTDGFFAQKLMEHFPWLPLEDEGRLNNFLLRERFLTRIFTLAAFREEVRLAAFNQPGEAFLHLLEFHAKNKELLRFYSQPIKTKLGQLVASHDGYNADAIIESYEALLRMALATHPRKEALANFFEHALGYFKAELKSSDREYYLDNLQQWRAGRLPASAVLSVARGWAMHYEKLWLLEQTIWQPYPPQLVDIHDSGKGRDL